MAHRNPKWALGLLSCREEALMDYRNAKGPIGILNAQEESSLAYRNPEWRKGILNCRQEFRMAHRNPHWPIGILNCLEESLSTTNFEDSVSPSGILYAMDRPPPGLHGPATQKRAEGTVGGGDHHTKRLPPDFEGELSLFANGTPVTPATVKVWTSALRRLRNTQTK